MSINNRAQVPGYCGYIPGKYSENKFGATFAQVTKDSYPTQPQSFLTTNIANNQFIQKQHSHEHGFWSNTGKISAFEQPSKKPLERTKRTPIQKFQAKPQTNLTYQQARNRKI